jgi:hypothetical protein
MKEVGEEQREEGERKKVEGGQQKLEGCQKKQVMKEQVWMAFWIRGPGASSLWEEVGLSSTQTTLVLVH